MTLHLFYFIWWFHIALKKVHQSVPLLLTWVLTAGVTRINLSFSHFSKCFLMFTVLQYHCSSYGVITISIPREAGNLKAALFGSSLKSSCSFLNFYFFFFFNNVFLFQLFLNVGFSPYFQMALILSVSFAHCG